MKKILLLSTILSFIVLNLISQEIVIGELSGAQSRIFFDAELKAEAFYSDNHSIESKIDDEASIDFDCDGKADLIFRLNKGNPALDLPNSFYMVVMDTSIELLVDSNKTYLGKKEEHLTLFSEKDTVNAFTANSAYFVGMQSGYKNSDTSYVYGISSHGGFCFSNCEYDALIENKYILIRKLIPFIGAYMYWVKLSVNIYENYTDDSYNYITATIQEASAYCMIDYEALDSMVVVTTELGDTSTTLSYSIKNNGASFDSIKTAFFWSADSIFDANDTFLAEVSDTAVAFYDTIKNKITINFPESLTQKKYYVFYLTNVSLKSDLWWNSNSMGGMPIENSDFRNYRFNQETDLSNNIGSYRLEFPYVIETNTNQIDAEGGADGEIVIYYNNGLFIKDLSGNLSPPSVLTLYNSTGQLLYRERIVINDDIITAPLNALPSSIYYIVLEGEDYRVVKKILIP